MFEFGSFAMKGFCSGFVGFGIGFAVAAEPEKSGRVDVPMLTIGTADAVAAAPPSSAAMAIATAALSRARDNFTDLTLGTSSSGVQTAGNLARYLRSVKLTLRKR